MGFASAPAVWGKLPTHADFIQHGVKSGEVQAWQHWLLSQARQVATLKPTVVPRLRAGERWMGLDPSPPRKSLAQTVPVCFVLPPGSMPFARDHILGVIANSHDRLGREHPIIVYHSANRRWLEQHLAGAEQHAGTPAVRFWLFALTRLLVRYLQGPDVDLEGGDGDGVPHAGGLALPETIAELWALYTPSWTQRLGIAAQPPKVDAVHAILRRAPAQLEANGTDDLQGMPQLPWADWPGRLWSKPCAAFWQQDSRGGYVAASVQLRELWAR